MKLSGVSVIYMIIIIPIILVFSYYISLQVNTIKMQTQYTSKQLSATRDAVAAFELNTVEFNENFSSVANVKRRSVLASINTFTSSFANSLGVTGTIKSDILTYIPAIAFTLYDGYYIYSPAETKEVIKNANGVRELDSDGNLLYVYDSKKGSIQTETYQGEGMYNGTQYTTNPNYAKTEYSHILKPFALYSARYVNDNTNTDIVVNYTLDNFITIYGTINGTYQIKSGYLVDENLKLPDSQELKEYIWYKGITNNKPQEFNYIYDSNNEKIYFDGSNNAFQINSNIRTNLSDSSVKYKKIVYNNQGTTYYIALNSGKIVGGKEIAKDEVYTDMKGTKAQISDGLRNGLKNNLYKDESAQNYYYESKIFTNWVKINLKDVGVKDIVAEEGAEYTSFEGKLFENAEDENSIFNKHKREVIKQTLISNLNQAITSYSRHHSGENYKLPVLSEEDWDKIINNISIITFVQNMPIGMKYYNNYIVATSSVNKEYVSPNEIYFTSDNDDYYHLPYCEKIQDTSNLVGYRNVDYVIKSYNFGENKTKYYYRHPKQECYYCIVQRDLYKENKQDDEEKIYNNALARERYVTHKFK